MPYHIYKLNKEGEREYLGGCREQPHGLAYTRGEAFAKAHRLNGETKGEWNVEQIIDDIWKQRERDRVISGSFKQVPWCDEPWAITIDTQDHFPYMSKSKPGMIAYTPTPEHGDDDRQVILSPGKYLNRYHREQLTDMEINRWVSACETSRYSLQIYDDPEDISEMYVTVDSCMGHDVDDFETDGRHPTEAYGKPGDLSLAVLRDRYHNPISRALVWTEKMLHGRCYGHISAIQTALSGAGYTAGSFDGARLNRIPLYDGDVFLCPYVDHSTTALRPGSGPRAANVDVTDEWIVINEDNGDYCADTTDGTIRTHNYHCDNCGVAVRRRDRIRVQGGDRVCRSCYHECFTECDNCGSAVGNDRTECATNGAEICDDCIYGDNYRHCDECGELYPIDEVSNFTADGSRWCDTCISDNNYVQNEDTGEWDAPADEETEPELELPAPEPAHPEPQRYLAALEAMGLNHDSAAAIDFTPGGVVVPTSDQAPAPNTTTPTVITETGYTLVRLVDGTAALRRTNNDE